MYEMRWNRSQEKIQPQKDPIQPFARNERKLTPKEIDLLKLKECKELLKRAYRTIEKLEENEIML